MSVSIVILVKVIKLLTVSLVQIEKMLNYLMYCRNHIMFIAKVVVNKRIPAIIVNKDKRIKCNQACKFSSNVMNYLFQTLYFNCKVLFRSHSYRI